MSPRRPRLHDEPYLEWLRTRHCVTCGKPPPSDAAHIRESSLAHDKPITGMGTKPDDRWAVPLCRGPSGCHAAQHANGNETEWWEARGLDPFNLARDYYAQFGGTGGKPKPPHKIKARKPKENRSKIIQRKAPWPKRSFR